APRLFLLQRAAGAGGVLRQPWRLGAASLRQGADPRPGRSGQGQGSDEQGGLPRPLRRRTGARRLSRGGLVHLRRSRRHRRDHRPPRPSRRDRREAPHLTPKSTERSTIPGPAGPLEIAQNVPEAPPRGIALVAHPHPLQGGTLDNKVAQTLAKTFYALGYAAIRFNFRGVGQSQGTFDEGRG